MIDALMNRYIKISNKIITSIKEYNEEECEAIILERREIINQISSLGQSKEQIRLCMEKYDIATKDIEVVKAIETRRNELKDELISLRKQKNASSVYGKQYSDINFINKKA